MDFTQQLIVGSYTFTVGCYIFGFFILKALYRIERALTHDQGEIEGEDLQRRVTRLERLVASRQITQ